MTTATKTIAAYVAFSGIRSYDEIFKLLQRVGNCPRINGSTEDYQLRFIQSKLTFALKHAYSASHKKVELIIDPAAIAEISKPQLGKYTDTGDVPSGGRQDQYWVYNKPKIQFDPKNHNVRKGSPIPQQIDLTNEKSILKYFNLRAIEYGQWLTQQDRVNYLAGCALSLIDLQKVLGFSPQQIGFFGFVSFAFGARGKGRALAHFEPSTFAINFTRFERPARGSFAEKNYDRSLLMFGSGGIGTLAHEYGHALDFFSGIFAETIPANIPNDEAFPYIAASFARSTRTKPIAELLNKKTIRGRMEKLMNKIINNSAGTFSNYYKRLLDECKSYTAGIADYYKQRAEIFARAFEVYVFYKMKKNNWHNMFLHDTKYAEKFYLSTSEIKILEKDFDDLIQAIRSALRPNVANLTKLIAVLSRVRRQKKGKSKPKGKSKR